MVIFPDLSEGMVEQVQVADEITVTLRVASQTACTGYLGYPFPKKRVNNRSTCSFFCHLHIRQVLSKILT
jgi:hypothetical protein